MTNERAIELLHRLQDEQFDGIHGDERREALSMAVRVLEDDGDTISRQAAIMAVKTGALSAATIFGRTDEGATAYYETVKAIKELPPVQPKKEIAKRVLWTGWKGYRDTRYKCPNCKKPVKNDDIHCHRCGQKLMFPHISFTDYVPGEKQETIVRWDDE